MSEVSSNRAQFARASRCGNSGACIEVAFVDNGEVKVRDSKVADGPVLTFDTNEWQVFLQAVRSGEFSGPDKRTQSTLDVKVDD